MTAVRAAARVALSAVLAAAWLAAMLFTAYGPGGAWRLAWLLLAAAVTVCAALAWLALWPEAVPLPCSCLCGCPSPGHREPDWSTSWCDPCRMNIHREA